MKKLIWVIIIIILIGLIWSNKDEPKVEVKNNEPIKVGAVLALSGPGASIGELVKSGYDLKIAELKEEGVLIDFYVEDSGTDPKKAISAFNLLTDINDVLAVFTIVSSDSMALKPLAEERKNVILWANATHPDLTNNTNYILRHSSTATDGADVVAESILKNEEKKVAILYQQDEWGVVFNKLLTEKLTQAGVQVFSEQIDNKNSDFKTQILKLKAQNPDALVYGVFGAAAGVAIKQTRELGYDGQLYAGVGFGLTPDAQKIAGDYAKGMYYQKYFLNPKFAEDYKNKFAKDTSPLGYIAYTDLEILMSAIKETKSRDPQILINYIKNLGNFTGKYETLTIEKNGDIVLPTTMEVW